MGFMDKVKAQAEQALAMAQQGVNQGQEKLDSLQTKRSADSLLRELGAAYYAQQRTGGSSDAVQAALAAVDRHAVEHGAVDTTPGKGASDTTSPTTTSPTTAPPSTAPPSSYSTSADSAPTYTAPTPTAAASPTFNQPPAFNPPPSFDPPSR